MTLRTAIGLWAVLLTVAPAAAPGTTLDRSAGVGPRDWGAGSLLQAQFNEPLTLPALPDGEASQPNAALLVEGQSFVLQGRRAFQTGRHRFDFNDVRGDLRVNIEGEGERWRLEIGMPDRQPFVASEQPIPAARAAFRTFDQAGLSFSGEGRGCNESDGFIVVEGAHYEGAILAALRVSFVFRCLDRGGGGPLVGVLCFDARAGNTSCRIE
jgi:hypothetical protein